MSKRENFYRRDPNKALSGMIGLSLEERGVYNTIIDMLYQTWRPLEDDRRYIANWCGCAVQKLNPIIDRLIAKGRLITFEEGGRIYLSDEAFEAEREAIKGASKTRSGRGEVREKSGEVGEKSASVEQNPPLLDGDSEEKQSVTALDKTREEKIRNPLSPPGGEAREGDQKPPTTRRQKPSPTARGPEAFERLWAAYPHSKGRSSRPKALLAWQKLDPDLAERLPQAAARFGREGREPNQECGAKALERWLADGNFGDWLEAAPAQTQTVRRFASEPIRQAVTARHGEDFARKWLDSCDWQEVPNRVIRAPNRYVADQLIREARDVLKSLDIHSVKIAQEAAA
jgi:hypothetical protein